MNVKLTEASRYAVCSICILRWCC